MSSSLLETIQSLPLADLNIKFALYSEKDNGEVDESYNMEHKYKIPVITLLKTRCIVTAQLMSYLFHGSDSVGWKFIDVKDLNLYPYVSVMIEANDDYYGETHKNTKSHALFLFKDTDGTTYKTESFSNYHKQSTATTQKFDKLPEIDANYHYTVSAPATIVPIDIKARVSAITSWIDANSDTLSDEYAVLLQ